MMADDDNDNDMADDDNDNAMAIVPELAAIANGINAQQARINEQTGINDAFDVRQTRIVDQTRILKPVLMMHLM